MMKMNNDKEDLGWHRTFNNQNISHNVSMIAVTTGFVFATLILGTAFLITMLKITGMI